MPTRTKISVSLPSRLVEDIDRGVRQRRYQSRSAAVELAIRGLARAQRDADIVAYYEGRSEADRAEERAWGELGYEGFVATARAEDRREPWPVRKRRAPRRKRR